MSDLFSNAEPAPAAPDAALDLEYRITVPASAGHAFSGFTEHIHLWWPSDELSVWGSSSFFDLEDRALVETSADDDETVWAEVTEVQPAISLRMVWHHRPGASDATGVSVQFTDADATSVLLVHGGWSAEPISRDTRRIYEEFWPMALERFLRFMGGTP